MADLDPTTGRVTLRELDALVAEHVMGWEWTNDPTTGEPCIVEMKYGPTALKSWHTLTEWHPSTDWSHTGELWEKLNGDGWEVAVWTDPDRSAKAQLANNSSMAGDEWSRLKDPRIVLCLAALRAYGVTVELEAEWKEGEGG